MADGSYSRSQRAFSRTNDSRAYDERDWNDDNSNGRSPPVNGYANSDPLQELARLIGQRPPFGGGHGRDEMDRGLGSPHDSPADSTYEQYSGREYPDQREDRDPRAYQVEPTYPKVPVYDDNHANRYDSNPDAGNHQARSGIAHSEHLLEQMREQVRQERERQGRERQERERQEWERQEWERQEHERQVREMREREMRERARYEHPAEFQQSAASAVHPDATPAAAYQADTAYPVDQAPQDAAPLQASEQAHADGEAHAAAEHGAYEAGGYSGHEGEAEEYAPEEYEDDGEMGDGEHPRPFRRRNATALAAAIFGLAVIGTAGAFGYYTVFKAGVQGPPPVIKADNSPTKMIPAGTSGEASSKPINERLGDASQERIVKREENPVLLRDPPRSATATIPAVAPPTMAAPSAIGAPDITAPMAPGSSAEPKKVRTVTIRADNPLQQAPSTDRTVQTRSSLQRAAAQQSVASIPQSGGNAPLALTPQAVGSTDSHTRSGGFVVQLSAQKSEAEAQASFSAMQQRYSALSGRQVLIRRKDQGERGVFYAAQVGPFGSREEAVQLCDSLKSVGGNCFVQRN